MKADDPPVCFYGVPWENHFLPPIGNGKGCPQCKLRFTN